MCDAALSALQAGRWQDAGVGGAGSLSGRFSPRVGADWHHTLWDFRDVIIAGPEKIHFDVQFTRYRADNSILGSYRSLWIVARLGGRWAVQARSTYAA